MGVDRFLLDTGGRDVVYRLDAQTFRGVDFSGLKADNFGVVGSVFEECDFRGMRVGMLSPGIGDRQSVYRRCDFSGAKIDKVLGGFARFEDCRFDDVVIKNWSAMEASFVDCTFSGKLRSVMFWGAHLERDFPAGYGRIEAGPNEFRGNDFSRCDLQDVSFEHGIDLGAQSLPVGEKYLVIEDGVGVLGRFLEDVGVDALPKRQRIALEVARDSLVSRNQRQAFLIKDRELGPIWDDLRAFCSADAPTADGAPTSS